MKKVIYTSITGGYDSLMQPDVIDDSFDYICFTNDIHDEAVGVWKIKPIPYRSDDSTIMSRYVKLQPHAVLEDYEYSVWMDANIRILGRKFYDVVDDRIANGCLVAQVPHLLRDCIYDDIVKCYIDSRISFGMASRQRKHLKEEGFPRHFGLFENNLVLRRHSDPVIIGISNEWWSEFLAYAHRDQFSLMPIYQRTGLMPDLLFGEGRNARNVDMLECIRHSNTTDVSRMTGIARLPWKLKWNWRKLVSGLFLR